NAAFRNYPMPGTSVEGEDLPPPLALDLYYLISAYGRDSDDMLAHKMMSRAMAILHQNTVGIIEPLYPPAVLLPEHEQAARRVAALWHDGGTTIMLCGRDPGARNIVAAAACAMADARLYVARVADLPTAASARENVYRLWERDAALTGGALMLDV